MSRKKVEMVAVALTITFIAFCAGYYVGQFTLADGSIVSDSALSAKADTTVSADLISAPPTDGQGVAVTSDATEPAAHPVLLEQAVSSAASTNSGARININTATVDELDKLPQIGVTMATRIIEFRQEYGSFKKIKDIMKVEGIGESTFNKIRDLITVGGDDN